MQTKESAAKEEADEQPNKRQSEQQGSTPVADIVARYDKLKHVSKVGVPFATSKSSCSKPKEEVKVQEPEKVEFARDLEVEGDEIQWTLPDSVTEKQESQKGEKHE